MAASVGTPVAMHYGNARRPSSMSHRSFVTGGVRAGAPTRAGIGCLLLATLIAVVHLARFDVTQGPIVTDVRYYVHFAERVADGAVPHRDFFDNKTQLATFAGAAFVAAGRAADVDPLLAMRVGYLVLTGLSALLLFVVLRRLYDGSCAAGLLGLLCYLGFSLLGFLPAIGPLPKVLMGVCAAIAALVAQRGWWMIAGAIGAVAFLDWQIGVLAGLGVFVAALCEPRDRLRHAIRAAIGGLAVLVAACVYFAAHGALGVAYRQVVLTSLARGESALAGRTFADRFAQILETVRVACPGHAWLAAIGVVGLVLFPLLVFRHRHDDRRRLAIALGVYHYGIVGFSLADFQAYGDLFALLASLAFFAGVALAEPWRLVARLVQPRAGDPATAARRRRAAAIAVIVLALLVLRIGRPRTDIVLPDKIQKGASTLDEQRDVARAIESATAGLGRVAFVNCPEQLYLTHRANELPIGFWNRATYSYFRASPEERSFQTIARLLDGVSPDAVVCPTPRSELDFLRRGGWERLALRAETGSYEVVLLRRNAAAGAGAAPRREHAADPTDADAEADAER